MKIYMTRTQKQILFDAITSVGYKNTERQLLKFMNGEEIDSTPEMETILAWFNLWINKGEYESAIQCIVSFINSSTRENPSKRGKAERATEITEDFKLKWLEKFGTLPKV